MNIELNENFKGKCLVSMPAVGDDIFHQCVIYITEHSTISGAIGVIINKSLEEEQKKLTDFEFQHYPKQWRNIPTNLGGPVKLGSGFLLHLSSDNSKLTLTGSQQKIRQLAREEQVTPLMLTAGFCLWETLQLEREVRFNNWLVLDDSARHLLSVTDPKQRYAEALRLAGITNLATFDFSGAGNA